MPNEEKLNLGPQECREALDEISRLEAQLGFLRELLRQEKFGGEEAARQLVAIRQVHDKLAGLFGVDPLSRALNESNRACREANARVRQLMGLLGQNTSTASAMARLGLCEDWFRTWHQFVGWKWMSLKWGAYGIRFETSEEVHHGPIPPEDHMFGDKRLAAKIEGTVPYGFQNFDLKEDAFHDSILDTQGNREALKALFKRAFPSACVDGFSSHLSGRAMLLRAQGFVPWEDIEKWRKEASDLEPEGPSDV